MPICPAISLVGETSVSGSLRAMDCQIEQAVELGYGRLFGAGGAFSVALTSALIIYVAVLAYGFMTGKTRLTMTMMSPRLISMALIMTFVTVWPAYHTVFYGLFMGGPDEVASALLGQDGSAVMNFAFSLDELFVRFADIAKSFATDQANTASIIQSKSMPVNLFWMSGLLLLISTLGVLILTRMVLYLLLILGPVFIVFALFPQTRGLFNGWIRTTLVFALAPLLSVLGGTAALALFSPLISSIEADPLRAVGQVQPMVILFIGALIYSAFLFVLMWVSASLVKDWQAALRDNAVDENAQKQLQQTHLRPYEYGTQHSNAALKDGYDAARVSSMVTSFDRADLRIGQAVGANQRQSSAQNDGTSRLSGVTSGFERGLGQRFKHPNKSQPFMSQTQNSQSSDRPVVKP